MVDHFMHYQSFRRSRKIGSRLLGIVAYITMVLFSSVQGGLNKK